MAGVKGMKHRRPRTAKERDVYAASRIEQLLDAAREGEIELSPTRLKAMELAYSRLKPTLSAVEQTNVDPRDAADPAQLAQRLASMFNEKPELLEQVRALMANASQQTPQVASEERVTH